MVDEKKEEVKATKKKKLSKSIAGTVLTITESVTGKVLTYDFAKLPDNIKANLGPYGLSQKLGDAAAGKEGQEAVDSIVKVAEGLAKGDWSVRAPAAEKINKADVAAKFNALDKAQKDLLAKNPATKTLLESLGVKF
jgi:hypothetical protein